MRLLFLAIIVLSFTCNTSFAQQAKVKKYTAPLAGKVVLRDVDDKYNANVYSMELPEPDAGIEQRKLYEIKEQIKQNYPHKKSPQQKKTTSVMAPVLGINFIADSMSGIPPDNYSAVSMGNKAVSVMNSNIAVHDAGTGAYLYRKGLMPFSASVGLNNTIFFTSYYRYDPKVVYDPGADRFICVMLNSTDDLNWIVLGFSQTNDPAGTWNFYKFYGDYTGDTTWFDYPAISVTQNEFFLTGNKIKYNTSWQAGFTRTLIYQVRKQDGYNGDSLLNYQIWDSVQYNNKFLRCLYPLNPGDSLLGPSQYFLSNRNFDSLNDTVFIVKVPDTIGSTDTILTVTPVTATTAYHVPPDGRQPDTSRTLATNDGRVLGGFIKGSEIQFVSTSLDPANGSSGIYHGIISNFNTAPAMTAQIYSFDTLDFGYPNISYAGDAGGNSHSIISFEYSGPKNFPGLAAILFDGTTYSDMLNIKSGDSSIYMLAQKEQRWGDYSGSQPDWSIPGAVWVAGIYGRKDMKYGNYMAWLQSPYHEGINILPSQIPSSKLYPNPAMQYISLEFTVNKEQVFSFFIYDVQGKLVDKVLDNYCHEGKNILQFNMAPLAPGTYFLKAIGANGENLPVQTFVRR